MIPEGSAGGLPGGGAASAGPATWETKPGTYCAGNWGADAGARTVKSLTECKASCAASTACVAITVDSKDTCVLCTSTTWTSAHWMTSYVKL
jgi:hypothetical protein